MTDDDKSLGDDATLQGSVQQPSKEEQSLGDRSTFHGGDASSISDLGGFADATDHDMEIVDLSGRYKIEETLGQGGMGEVLLATDTRLDRKVAIKRIRGDAGSSKAAVARFLTEAKSVAALNHPNVVQIHDYGRDESGPFLIMEYVSGGSLLDRCKQGPMELEEAVELACQLCDGLGRAHDAGIIHRDIKPANILLTHDGVPKLTDFGLAKADSRDHTMTMAGAVLGTLDFMPPEQRQDASLTDSRSDLWSLAASLYQMVTGESPKVIRLKKVPSQIRDVLDKALEESKKDRYQSAAELGTALQDAKRGRTISTTDIDEGQCPSCGAKNSSSRKFCKECAASLVINCLKCDSSIRIWEKVCGECGAKQSKLAATRRTQMDEDKKLAEESLNRDELDAALEIAVKLRDEPDPRLRHLTTWAGQFANRIEQKKNDQKALAKVLLSEAVKHEQSYDYEAGIKTLERLPPAVRSQLADIEEALDQLRTQQKFVDDRKAEMEELKRRAEKFLEQEAFDDAIKLADKLRNEKDPRLQQLQKWANQFRVQIETCRQRQKEHASRLVKSLSDEALQRELTGELVLAIESLEQIPHHLRSELLPGKSYSIANMLSRLKKKHTVSTVLAEAKRFFEEQNYEGCLSRIEDLPPASLTSELNELRSKTTVCLDRLRELRSEIEAAIVVNRIDKVEVAAREYETLKKDDSWFCSIRPQLDAATKQTRMTSVLAQAWNLRSECRFDEAVAVLDELSNSTDNKEFRNLRLECESLLQLRSNVRSAMECAKSLNDFDAAYEQVCEYGDAMKAKQLQDKSVEELYKSFEQRMNLKRSKGQLFEIVLAGLLVILIIAVSSVRPGMLCPSFLCLFVVLPLIRLYRNQM